MCTIGLYRRVCVNSKIWVNGGILLPHRKGGGTIRNCLCLFKLRHSKIILLHFSIQLNMLSYLIMRTNLAKLLTTYLKMRLCRMIRFLQRYTHKSFELRESFKNVFCNSFARTRPYAYTHNTRTNTHSHTHTHTHTHTHIHTLTHTQLRKTHTCTHTHTHTNTHTHTYTNAHTHTHTQTKHRHIRLCLSNTDSVMAKVNIYNYSYSECVRSLMTPAFTG